MAAQRAPREKFDLERIQRQAQGPSDAVSLQRELSFCSPLSTLGSMDVPIKMAMLPPGPESASTALIGASPAPVAHSYPLLPATPSPVGSSH